MYENKINQLKQEGFSNEIFYQRQSFSVIGKLFCYVLYF